MKKNDYVNIRVRRKDAQALLQFVEAPAETEMEKHWIKILDRISKAIKKSLTLKKE